MAVQSNSTNSQSLHVYNCNNCKLNMAKYSFVSYNMHGFNQGIPLLKSMCDRNELNVDCIFIQEHWLTPSNLHRFDCFSDSYMFYGKSAMEKIVSASVLRGRPFGGVGFLLRHDLCKHITFQHLDERFAIIVFDNIVLITIYMPSGSTSEDIDIITDIFTNIDIILTQIQAEEVILAGDINVNLAGSQPTVPIIKSFMSDWSLEACSSLLSRKKNVIDYTYKHESLGHTSYIDYFLISSKMMCNVYDFDILDSAINMSDHNPVTIIY